VKQYACLGQKIFRVGTLFGQHCTGRSYRVDPALAECANEGASSEHPYQSRTASRVFLAAHLAYWLEHGAFTHKEALSIIEHAREEILKLCPGKDEVFELVLRPRFLRILDERALAEWGTADSLN